MSGGGVIIICGTGDGPGVDKTIVVFDAPFSVAIKIDTQALYNDAVSGGLSPSKASERVNRLVSKVEGSWSDWADFIEDKLGLIYTRHVPHAQP